MGNIFMKKCEDVFETAKKLIRMIELKKEAERLKDEYANKVRELEKEKEDILTKAYQESEDMMKNMQGGGIPR